MVVICHILFCFSIGKKVQYDGGFGNKTCKYHVLFMHCYSDAYVESREEFMKVTFMITIMKPALKSPDFIHEWKIISFSALS